MVNTEPIPHRNGTPAPDMVFFNKGEPQNATQMISAALTLVSLDMMPDLDFLYRLIVKKTAFVAVLICWALWAKISGIK